MQNKFHTSLFLKHQPICEGKLHYFDELQSSSDYAKQLVQTGAASGTLVIAEHQTLGRGRGGNLWQSPAGDGLLFTLVIDPDIEQAYWHRFSIVAGVAIAKAVETLCPSAPKVQLKWPNDIYINGKKCAGILTEIVSGKILIGIGINVSTGDFPEELAHKASSLSREGIVLEREILLAEIVSQIFTLGSIAGSSFAHIIKSYKDRCMLTGHVVKFISEDRPQAGVVTAINEHGALVVNQNGINHAIVEAREIQIVK